MYVNCSTIVSFSILISLALSISQSLMKHAHQLSVSLRKCAREFASTCGLSVANSLTHTRPHTLQPPPHSPRHQFSHSRETLFHMILCRYPDTGDAIVQYVDCLLFGIRPSGFHASHPAARQPRPSNPTRCEQQRKPKSQKTRTPPPPPPPPIPTPLPPEHKRNDHTRDTCTCATQQHLLHPFTQSYNNHNNNTTTVSFIQLSPCHCRLCNLTSRDSNSKSSMRSSICPCVCACVCVHICEITVGVLCVFC